MTKRFPVLLAAVAQMALAAQAEVLCCSPDGKIPEVNQLLDDEFAFRKYAETADVVAFDRIPRSNLLQSWKTLGVKVLKIMRSDPERSPEMYRRQAGFQAFKDGADGLYLADKPAGEYARALEEAKEDLRVAEYVRSLWEKARASDDGLVRIEGRRAQYYLKGFLPSEWENLDTIRLECTAWAKRLEQLLGVKPAKLPTTLPEKPLPEAASFKPFAGHEDIIETLAVGPEGKAVTAENGITFRWDTAGFSVTVETKKGRELQNRWQAPGGELDFRLYLAGKKPGEWMPYRYHVDLEPMIKGSPRAPARGRGSYLYGTDERFVPYDQAYNSNNTRIREWPLLRSHGPDCPALRPSFSIEPVKGGGYRATFSVGWLSLYGRWPMQNPAVRGEVWYIGVDKMPETGAQAACKLTWPKGSPLLFDKFCQRFSTGDITGIYKQELARTYERNMGGFRDRYYRFLKTKDPTFNLGDLESDEMFRTRLSQPLFDANNDAWQMIWTDKEHPSPTLRKQTPTVQKVIHKMLGRMLYLSHQVGLLRRDYLVGRFAGKEPPEPPKKKAAESPLQKAPDADFDEDAIQLDDKEF